MRAEKLELPDALTHVLDECRMVLPGIQALFGFQMIAVFSPGFSQTLTAGEQKLHLGAILLVVVSIILIMTPAALHRRAEPIAVSDRFIRAATRLILWAMVPLCLGICVDIFLVTAMIWHSQTAAWIVSVTGFVLFVLLWEIYPSLYRRRGGEGVAQ